MPNSILIAYATRYGTTQEAAGVVAETLREHGFVVDILPARDIRTLATYQAVVLGAPLFMFHWHKDALQFLSRHQKALKECPVAVFALGPVQSPRNEQEWKNSRDHLDQELAKFPWLVPIEVKIFGGKFDPTKLGFLLGLFAGKEPASDIRDLNAIQTWANSLAVKLKPEAS